MSGNIRKVGDQVRSWFTTNAKQLTLRFYADDGAEPLDPGEGYVRLWLAEGFLATARSWGNDHFPALHGGVTLSFAGRATPFTRFTKPSAPLSAGVYLDYPMTTLLPFVGGTVELEAGLYRATVAGPLAAAVEIGGKLASLIGPPLSMAADIADKISQGLGIVLDAQKEAPVLGLHHTLVSDGGGGQVLRSGSLVLINAQEHELPAGLRMENGRLRSDSGLLTGFDYLVLRVECRTEHDELRFPQLASLQQRAATEWLSGEVERFKQIRALAITEAVGSADLIARDRFRLAKYVADQIDLVKELGAVPQEDGGFDPVPARLLPDAEEVAKLTLDDLLA
ncbi:hypothetical protein [Amycolatopsis orientalis]|uniref:hypothetical protein n=1 Tax=Amycolatopsis orientalis TaxID=31958 RepID=UPI0003FC4632|nr:hypothetical protein [Amycolatopsis orientalis]